MRIVFVIDACDRQIIAWSAVANADISGEMVCDLMIAAVGVASVPQGPTPVGVAI